MSLEAKFAKTLDYVPVTEGTRDGFDPRPKQKGGVTRDLRKLFRFIELPATFSIGEYIYKRQLLFTYNITVDEDFYFLNIPHYRAFTEDIIVGGCLCVRHRSEATPFRYKLFDHDRENNWSYFEPYTNQRIKKNFVLEFWGNDLLPHELLYNRGIIQNMLLQMGSYYNPSTFEEDPSITTLANPNRLIDLSVVFPFHYTTNPNMYWLNNSF